MTDSAEIARLKAEAAQAAAEAAAAKAAAAQAALDAAIASTPASAVEQAGEPPAQAADAAPSDEPAAAAEQPQQPVQEPVQEPAPAQAETAAKRGETNGYLAVEGDQPVLHVTQQGNEADTTRVLRVVMDSYTQRRAEYEALFKAGAAPEKLAALETDQAFTHSISVTPSPVKPQTHYYFALLAFACGMGTTVAMVAVKGIMAVSPVGARQTLAGLPRWKVLTATLAASWVCVFVCLLVAFTFMALVVGVDFGPHVLLCLVAIGVCSLMASAAGAALGTLARLEIGMISGFTSPLSLFTGLYGPASQSLASSIEQHAPLLAQANPLWQTARCFYGLLYYDSLEPFTRSCAVLLGMTCLFLTIALIRARRMTHEHL